MPLQAAIDVPFAEIYVLSKLILATCSKQSQQPI